MQQQQNEKQTNILSYTTSGFTLLVMAIASYAIAMFMLSSNTYQAEVTVTSSLENRVLQLRSDFNKQAQLWNSSSFAKLNHSAQARTWKKFVAGHQGIQEQGIAIFSDIKQHPEASQEISRFLALYNDLTLRYQYQKERMELGDEVSFTSKRAMNALIFEANGYLDDTVHALRNELLSLTSSNNTLMENGSMASIVALALILPTMLFLSAGIYYRQRVL